MSAKEDTEKLIVRTVTLERERPPSRLLFRVIIVAFLLLLSLSTAWYVHCWLIKPTHVLVELTEEESIPVYYDDGSYDVEDLVQDVLSEKFPEKKNDDCSFIEDNFRFDCYPESGASQEKCKARGCCWAPPKDPKAGEGLGVPWCFYPDNYPDYYVVNQTRTPTGIEAFYARNGSSYYPNDVQLLKWELQTMGPIARVKMYDANNPRYEVPYFKETKPNIGLGSDYEINFNHRTKFEIIHKPTQQKVFTPMSALIYTDQFIQISSVLSFPYVYGLGERRDNFLRSVNWQRFTMFAADQPPRDNSNLYGSHPFMLIVGDSAPVAYGLFMINSNAMDVILQPAPAFTFRLTGGIIDMVFFAAPTPAEVISQYLDFIGKPAMPPYWGLGFHLCRFGYNSANRTREIWEKNRQAGIPFDVQWNDIDYMDHRRDFSYDKVKFKELPELVNDIHKAGMHYVLMTDPGIDYSSTPNVYPPFDEGVKQDIFIKNSSDQLFIGKVWSPNGAVFPDFTNPKTTQYWTEQLSGFHSEIPFDGLWIDMNEPSNFYDGTVSGCPNSRFENPPYLPNVNGGKMYYKTLCMTAKQNLSIHYNVHNLYGITEANATNSALKTIRQKRPFIISRSTFPGHGRYAGHWTGDIFSTWDDLGKSIPGILDFNIFGIPLVGADICGFNGNTTVELCTRWMQLGAFYPFSRNHNSDDTIDQDPASLGPEVVAASVIALRTRYALLPYLYTLFYRAHMFGETVARPLFFEFPRDVKTFEIDTQFLWGSGIMFLPVLQENVTLIKPYFPKGTWYLPFGVEFQRIDSKGSFWPVPSPLEIINIAYRSRHIIPVQMYNGTTVTTTASRLDPKGLIIFFDDEQTATGELFWDDGESLDTIENKKYNLLKFTATKGMLTSTVVHFGAPEEPLILGFFMVFGVLEEPKQVLVNDKETPFKYLAPQQELVCVNFTISMESAFTITWN